MVTNATRAHMAEFGIIAPVGRGGVDRLVAVIDDEADQRVSAAECQPEPEGPLSRGTLWSYRGAGDDFSHSGRRISMKGYRGACHCGAVQFSILIDPDYSVRCDCSMCRRHVSVMFRCDEADLEILSGHDSLSTYQFNTQVAVHYFCRHCGVYTFHKMRKLPDKYGVNAGCIDGIDLFALRPVMIKGSET